MITYAEYLQGTNEEAQILDHLSLSSVAANLHYRYEQMGGLNAGEAVNYATRLLKLIGYREPDHLTLQAAIQAWQQMYPSDTVLPDVLDDQSAQPTIDVPGQAPGTVPQKSYGFGTEGKVAMLGDGDGYVMCDQGHRHWGQYGAAGMLLRTQDPQGQTRYLLAKRSPAVHEGNCWGIPGGAIDSHETPMQGALRETNEEFANVPQTQNHQIIHANDHGGWAYHTVLADTPYFQPQIHPQARWETDDAQWFKPEEISQLPLHSGFQQTWNQLQGQKSGSSRKFAYTPMGLSYLITQPEDEEEDEDNKRTNTVPTPTDRWPDWGGLSEDEKHHRDVPISNDYYPGV